MQASSTQKKVSTMGAFLSDQSLTIISSCISLGILKPMLLPKLLDQVRMGDLYLQKTLDISKRSHKMLASLLESLVWREIIQVLGSWWQSNWSHRNISRQGLENLQFRWESLARFLLKLAWLPSKINAWSRQLSLRPLFILPLHKIPRSGTR